MVMVNLLILDLLLIFKRRELLIKFHVLILTTHCFESLVLNVFHIHEIQETKI